MELIKFQEEANDAISILKTKVLQGTESATKALAMVKAMEKALADLKKTVSPIAAEYINDRGKVEEWGCKFSTYTRTTYKYDGLYDEYDNTKAHLKQLEDKMKKAADLADTGAMFVTEDGEQIPAAVKEISAPIIKIS